MAVVGPHEARVRMQPDGNPRFQRQCFGVQDPDFVVAFVAGKEFAGAGMNGQAGEKDLRASCFGCDGAVKSRHAVGVGENVNLPGVAARHVEAMAVAAEGNAVPGFFQRQKLCLLAADGIEERHAMLIEPAMHRHHPFVVGRHHQLERQVTDQRVLASGSDAPTIEEEVRVRSQSLSFSNGGAVDIFAGLADRLVRR